MPTNKGFEAARDAVDSIVQRRTAAGAKSITARLAFSAEAVEIGHWLDRHAPRRREELGEAIGKRLDIGIVPVPAGEAAVQHLLGAKPDHLDQPVDDDAPAANRQAVAAGQSKWHDAEINIGGEPAIEPHLCFGIAAPGFGSRKIKTVAAQRLLQFVDVPI